MKIGKSYFFAISKIGDGIITINIRKNIAQQTAESIIRLNSDIIDRFFTWIFNTIVICI